MTISRQLPNIMTRHLQDVDPELHSMIKRESHRQLFGLELIASENYTSQAVLDCLGSILTNKYSEGLPGARYYGGNEHIDEIENLCRQRALEAFHLNPDEWGVNVQPYSGSPANFAAYTALLNPHDRIMGLDLPSGGHLTHGYQTTKKKISATSIFFESMPYQVHPDTGMIDYDQLERNSKLFFPKLIICGGSAYPREWDYARLKKIADDAGAYLLADIAHISGLVATQEASNPFEYCDVVTTTTHKTLRGPRAGIIFFRKLKRGTTEPTDLESRVNQAVFPGCQGGPHNNVIAAIAVTLKQVMTPEFKQYSKQVKENCKELATVLQKFGYKIATNGTDNHLLLLDLRPNGLTGSKVEKVCELVNISVNKNTVHGDKSALSPCGIRLGTAALTTRGFQVHDMSIVASFINDCIQLCSSIQGDSKMTMKEFQEALNGYKNELNQLKSRVEKYASSFPVPAP